LLAYLAGTFVLGFAFGAGNPRTDGNAPVSPASGTRRTATGDPPPVAAFPRAVTRDVRQAAASSPEPGPEAVRTAQTAQGIRLLQSLYDHTNRLKAQAEPGTAPETVANEATAFLTGWVDALRFTSAQVLNAVGEGVRARVCAGGLSAEETLVSAHVLLWLPEVATGPTFDCFLQDRQRSGVEDVELWAVLDAWRNSGLEPPRSLAALRATARDPRTLRRFSAPGDGSSGRRATSNPAAR
jgi:hypothetical protein